MILSGLLSDFFIQRAHPIVFLCNSDGIIKAHEGALAFYHWTQSNCSGKPVSELVPALWGRDLNCSGFIPFVELENGSTIGIQIQPEASGLVAIIIFDQSEEKLWRQQVQQVAKNKILLNEKLSRSTELLRSKNEELDRAYQVKNEFIASVSHELRTPLSSIIGHADTLKLELAANEDRLVRDSVNTIGQNARHLLALLENILEQGRLTADSLVLSPDSIDTEEFFSGILHTFEPIAAGKKLKFRLEYHFPPGTTLYYDEHYLRLVLINLISNAVKFTLKGSIKVYARGFDKRLYIDVADSGIGIEEGALSTLFQPFKRGNNSKGIAGVGLGLNIVREVVTAMDGEIHVSSKLGVGTTFSIQIPEPQRDYSKVAVPDGENIRVLIVEDDPDLIALYKVFITRSGMEPVIAEDFLDIRSELRLKQPDIIVLDYNLGETNGIEVLAELRETCPDIPVIMFTATTGINDSLREKADLLGCHAFLYKPRDMARLSRVIKEVINDVRK